MDCIICGGTAFETLAERLRHDVPRRVVRCRSCTLVSLEDPEREPFEYGARYDRLYTPVLGEATTPSQLYELYAPHQADRLRRLDGVLRSTDQLLEIGCSAGHFLEAVRPHVAGVAGIELNAERAAHARDLGFEIAEEAVERHPFGGRTFDVIVAYQVFEHLADPLAFLATARDLLAPGGRLVLEVPNVDECLLTVFALQEYADFHWREPHVYYYSQTTLRQILELGGFRGAVRQVQNFSLFNHVHWLLHRTPQKSVADAVDVPAWSSTAHPRSEVMRAWLDEANRSYKELLEQEGIAECLLFVGSVEPPVG